MAFFSFFIAHFEDMLSGQKAILRLRPLKELNMMSGSLVISETRESFDLSFGAQQGSL